MKKPWKIEYSNDDGVKYDFRGTFSSPLKAMEKAHAHWIDNFVEYDSDAQIGWVAGAKRFSDAVEQRSYIVHSDGFHTYTVFHTDSVRYG